MVNYADGLLHRWGKWVERNASKGLGYSKISPMFKQAQHGGSFGSSVPVGVEIGGIVEIRDTDAAVSRMSNKDKAIINARYVRQDTAVKIANEMGLSRQGFYNELTRTQSRFLGTLQDVLAEI